MASQTLNHVAGSHFGSCPGVDMPGVGVVHGASCACGRLPEPLASLLEIEEACTITEPREAGAVLIFADPEEPIAVHADQLRAQLQRFISRVQANLDLLRCTMRVLELLTAAQRLLAQIDEQFPETPTAKEVAPSGEPGRRCAGKRAAFDREHGATEGGR